MKKLNFRHFNTNSKKFTVTVNFHSDRNKDGSKIVGKLSEGHLNVLGHFRRFPKRNPKLFRLYTKEKQFIHHLSKEKALTNVRSSIHSHLKDIISFTV